MSVQAKRLVIRGRVQGVGYRDSAVQAAFELGVLGWVRNHRDGSVEAHVQGAPAMVERFAVWCRRGPPLARVSEVTIVEVEPDDSLSAFETRATA
jgi:acylphosphatase